MEDSGLHLLDPELPEQLRRCSVQSLRSLNREICILAAERVGVNDSIVQDGIAALEGERYDDRIRDQLQALVSDLDEKQWDLQDCVEAGTASQESYLAAFRAARAVNALLSALDPDPLEASAATIYEASFAVDDWLSLHSIISRHLSECISPPKPLM